MALVAVGLVGCDVRRPDPVATADPSAGRRCPSPYDTGGDVGSRQGPPKPDPAASVSPPVPFGQPSSTVGSGFDVEFIVYAYKQPAGSACPDPYQPDHDWAAVDVRVCAKSLPSGFPYTLAWTTWSVAYADGTTAYASTFTFADFEQPKYPNIGVLSVGQCTRGWITLSVPRGKRPVTVLYQPVGEIHTWTVPATS